MRDYTNLDLYISELDSDIYYQPDSDEHTTKSSELVAAWLSNMLTDRTRLLDLGCGTGFFDALLKPTRVQYHGISMNDQEVAEAVSQGRNVRKMDFNFLDYPDDSFDVLLSRHSLEHSFSSILSLMEWHRVSRRWLALVLPNPTYHTYVGRNHMNVMNAHQSAWMLRRAGWKLHRLSIRMEEFWFLCIKVPRISYEGWINPPIPNKLYEFERDLNHIRGDIDVPAYFRARNWDGIF